MRYLHLSDIAARGPTGEMVAHGSAVVFEGKGVLFFGPSGAGKSAAALALMAHGATLLCDDRVIVRDGPVLAAPDRAVPAIEARWIGLLNATLAHGLVPFSLAVSLAEREPDRLPPSRFLDCGQGKVPLILAAGHPNLAPVVMQYLRKGRYR